MLTTVGPSCIFIKDKRMSSNCCLDHFGHNPYIIKFEENDNCAGYKQSSVIFIVLSNYSLLKVETMLSKMITNPNCYRLSLICFRNLSYSKIQFQYQLLRVFAIFVDRTCTISLLSIINSLVII